MANPEAGLVGIAAFLMLLACGVPIAFAGALVGFVGLWIVAGLNPALTLLGTLPHSVTANYVFAVLPLFILMGYAAAASGLTQDIYATTRHWLGRLPGGLAVATVAGGAFFGAASGSSVAAASLFSQLALPEMRKLGYQARFAAGSVTVAGLLSILVPPSNMVVMYGIIAEQSIGKLLLAIWIPGLLLASLSILTIVFRAWRNPSLGGAIQEVVTWRERLTSLKGVLGIGILSMAVMGGIYTGAVTPVEAGALGAFGAILLGLATRRLKRDGLWQAMLATARTASMVFIILVGSFILNAFLAYVRLATALAEFLVGLQLPAMVILVGILLFYLIMGTFMEEIGMMILTLPIIVPSLPTLGIDPIWFGVLVVLMMAIGLISPPVGMVVFAVKSATPDLTVGDIFWGVMPMMPAAIAVVILVVVFPQLALFIPNLMAR